MAFSQIGFISRAFTNVEKINEKDSLLTFDDGSGLTFEQGTRNTLVTGQTGSGKTESVIRPMIYNLIRRGLGGIIFDVKGSLRQDVYALAKSVGREGDIVEFGSSQDAYRTNLFAGLAIHECKTIIDYLVLDETKSDQNVFWHMKGAKSCLDIYKMLSILSRIEPDCAFSKMFTPTLGLIDKVLTYDHIRWSLFEFFKNEIRDIKFSREREKYADLVREADQLLAEIDRNKFHYLDISPFDNGTTRSNQTAWQLEKINDQLSLLNTTNDLLNKFSAIDENSVPMDFKTFIYEQKKIILLHFSVDCGRAGEILSNIIKNCYYQVVLKYGLSQNTYSFLVADEFQHIVNVEKTRFLNDMDIFCISRQYKIINIIATQNIASLLARGRNEAIHSLIGNCTNKIFLQNCDTITREWSHNIFPVKYSIGRLKRGEALVEMIDGEGSEKTVNVELNNAFTSSSKIIKQTKPYTQTAKKCYTSPYAIANTGFPEVIDDNMFMYYTNYLKENKKCRVEKKGDVAARTSTASEEMTEYLQGLRTRSKKGLSFLDLIEPSDEDDEEMSDEATDGIIDLDDDDIVLIEINSEEEAQAALAKAAQMRKSREKK